MNRFLPIFVLLAACAACDEDFPETHAPSCNVQREAVRVAVAYANLFDHTPTEAEYACVESFRIGMVHQNVLGEGVGGMYLPERGNVILIAIEGWVQRSPSGRRVTLHHELAHHVIYCLEGDEDVYHSHPAWAGEDDLAEIPGGVVWEARFTADPFACEPTNETPWEHETL